MVEASLSPRRRVLVSWSSGKDCAWMLHVLQQMPDVEVVALVTSLNEATNRVAMHGVREDLLKLQAARLGVPLWIFNLPWPCSNEIYEFRFKQILARAAQAGVTQIAFGDLFLEEIREYRCRLLADSGIEPWFPIWCGGEGTRQLASKMINAGFRSVLTCIDRKRLPVELLGQEYTAEFLNELPRGVDPCGENGEFHTYCFAGPIYSAAIDVQLGEQIEQDGFRFVDLSVLK